MKMSGLKIGLIMAIGIFTVSCDKEQEDNVNKIVVLKSQVVENYANIAAANYKQAYDDAVLLETAITNFTKTPTAVNFSAAKKAWKMARESYGTTEAFRFADGPIDNENGPEGFINSWPLDENYIDYVDTDDDAGIINNSNLFASINKETLEGENGKNDNEKYVTVGYHAIEFLLWGQDLTLPSAKLAGQRSYTDYLTTTAGTANNAKRRADYLNACADLLTDHLLYLKNEWQVGGSYRTTFLSLEKDLAIKNIYRGITTLASAELPVERMEVALGNQDQEDEHSCFSDNTHRDIILNLQGIINIYQGKYESINGASIEDLVKEANLNTFNETLNQITIAQNRVDVMAIPFDFAISGGETSAEGIKVKAAATAIKTLAKNLLDGAAKIGINLNI